MRWRRRSLPSLSSFLFSFSLLGGKRETTLIQILSQGRSRGRRGEMGCRESKRERGGKGLGAKKNKGNQPTATPRNGNHYSPLSTSFPPPFSVVVVYSHSPAPSFVVTVQEVCILYCALPPFAPLPKSPFSLLLFRRRRHLTASSKLG